MKRDHLSIAKFIFAVALFLSSGVAGCSRTATEALKPVSPKDEMPIVLCSSSDFGYLLSGSARITRLVRVRNSSDTAVRVSRWAASCECLTIEPASIIIDPGKATFIRLAFDPVKESDQFVGSLCMTVEGFADAQCVGKFEVLVAVIAAEDAQHLDGVQK